ncbi:hypothetical protein HK101_002083, partial [Irineochytrium annulatum]
MDELVRTEAALTQQLKDLLHSLTRAVSTRAEQLHTKIRSQVVAVECLRGDIEVLAERFDRTRSLLGKNLPPEEFVFWLRRKESYQAAKRNSYPSKDATLVTTPFRPDDDGFLPVRGSSGAAHRSASVRSASIRSSGIIVVGDRWGGLPTPTAAATGNTEVQVALLGDGSLHAELEGGGGARLDGSTGSALYPRRSVSDSKVAAETSSASLLSAFQTGGGGLQEQTRMAPVGGGALNLQEQLKQNIARRAEN